MKLLSAIFFVFVTIAAAFAQNASQKQLILQIVDSDNFPIVNAKITTASTSGKKGICRSIDSGKYMCEIDFEGDILLTIQAEGFSMIRRTVQLAQDFSEKLSITLTPQTLKEQVVVTANRTETKIADTAASIVSISKNEISLTAAPAIDDVLRQVPGFSLFRRSGSRTANPTTQGVSLRGVGASGAGRSLVLFDDLPVNDPFGGWVAWSRIPAIAVESVEVLRGGASNLYGNNSLSGTVNIIPRKSREKFSSSIEIYGGNQRTFSASTYFGFSVNGWSADFTAAIFQYRGYIPIEKELRGAADSFAGSRNSSISVRIEKSFDENAALFFKTSYFGEARENGTILQQNRTHFQQFAFGGELKHPIETNGLSEKISNIRFNWRLYGGTQVFNQTFSALSNDRNTENLVRLQRVPAQTFGFSGQLSGVIGGNHSLILGFEGKEVRGASNETGFFNNRATSQNGSGGRERTFSIYLQDFIRIGRRVVFSGSGRFDRWENVRASSVIKTLSTNIVTATNFPDKRATKFSPHGSILVQATDYLSFHVLASKSFRAPTLNELYRGFRVGNVITNPNENLKAENAVNFEAGASYGFRNLYIRGNLFFTEISDPISNVTISITPILITRQRQNIGKTRASGFEIDAEKRWDKFTFSAGYLHSDSKIVEFSANNNLQGLRVPLVSKHQFTFQTSYENKAGWNFSLQGRASSAQFDDDQNLFRLEPYFQLDAFGSKRLWEKSRIFIGIENFLNSRYSIGKTPLRSIGSPINGRIGIRWN